MATPRLVRCTAVFPLVLLLSIASLFAAPPTNLSTPPPDKPAEPKWSVSTGPSLLAARYFHTSTLLQNGDVLIAGGTNGSTVLASAELIKKDGTGVVAAGSMATARYAHTATLLPNGKVLIAGGHSGTAGVSSAEIYDPATNTFSTIAVGMSTARYGHTATLLKTGAVLIAGGDTGTLAVSMNPEKGNMPSRATLTSSAELFDYTTGTFTPAGTMQHARYIHTATRLQDGRVLLTGGFDGAAYLNSAELYDPANGTFTATASSMSNPRYAHTATGLTDGRVLVFGGFNGSSAIVSPEVYNPANGYFSPAPYYWNFSARYFHSATSNSNGDMIFSGGTNGSGPVTTVDFISSNLNGYGSLSLTVPRAYHAATLLSGGQILLSGGSSRGAIPSCEIVSIESSGTWSDYSQSYRGYWSTATVLTDGNVLIAGGESRPTSASVFDTATRTSTAVPMAFGRSYHTSTLLNTGQVLVAGGNYSPGTAEIFDPATNSFGSTAAMPFQRMAHSATVLTDGRVALIGGNVDGNRVEVFDPLTGAFTPIAAPMALWRYYAASTLLPDGRVFIASNCSSEVFDPAVGTFSDYRNVGFCANPRFGTATLRSGKVAVFGSGSYAIYDPATATYSAPKPTGHSSYMAGSYALADGSVLVEGDYGSDSYVYDPQTNQVRSSPFYAYYGGQNAVAVLADGSVLISDSYYTSISSAAASSATRRPLIESAPATLNGGTIAVTGSRFASDTEANGSFNSSSTAFPLLSLSRIGDSVVSRIVNMDPATSWSDSSFTSEATGALNPGFYRASILSNGLWSSKIIPYYGCTATMSEPTITQTAGTNPSCQNDTVTLDAGAGYTSYYWSNGATTQTITVNPTAPTSYSVFVTDGSGCAIPAAVYRQDVQANLSAVSIAINGATGTCATATGGTMHVTDNGGGTKTHEWGYRTTSGGTITPITGQTAVDYILNGADFPAPGSYFVVCTTTPSCGSVTTSNEIGITVGPPPTANVGGTATICPGTSTTIFADLAGTGPWNVTWSDGFLQNGVISSPVTRIVSPSADTTYTVTSVSDTTTGCSGPATGEAVITIDPTGPSAQITAAPAVCGLSTGNLASVPDAGTGAAYAWSITNGTITSANNIREITWTADATGPVTLSVNVSNASGCASVNGSQNVIVYQLPDATITTNPTACASSTGNTASVPFAIDGTYSWQITNGTITAGAGTNVITFTAGTSGNVDLSVTVTSANGCPKSSSQQIPINPLADATITAPSSTCGESAGNNASVPDAGLGSTYSWWIENGTLTSPEAARTITFTAGSNGTTTLHVTVTTAAGCATQSSANVTVNALPTVSISASGATSFCSGGSVGLTANASGGSGSYSTYTWYRDDLPIPGATASTYSATQTGAYNVIVTDSLGCVSYASAPVAVTVTPAPDATISTAPDVCPSSTGHTASVADAGPGASYFWTISNGSIVGSATGSSITFDAPASGVVTLNVSVQNSVGCSAAQSKDVTVTPSPAGAPITVTNWVPINSTGVIASVPDNAGSTYNWTLSGGTITSGQGTHQITFNGGYAGTTMQLGVNETLSSNCTPLPRTSLVQVDFFDVPPAHGFHTFVDTLARNGVTAGCGYGNYCPNGNNTRAQMAVFLLRGKHGSTYTPPPATGTVFGDVPPWSFAASWIEQLSNEGIDSGCGGGNYCPGNTVTRGMMAPMILKTKWGSSFVPPAPAGIFGDVPVDDPLAPWVEELYNEGITGGCSTDPLLYCPNGPNTRGQMSVFIDVALGLN